MDELVKGNYLGEMKIHPVPKEAVYPFLVCTIRSAFRSGEHV